MKNVYYASVYAKLPRKRKEQRFEVRLNGETPLEAREAIQGLIKMHNLKSPRAASFQLWSISESEYTDSNGQKQTLVMRSVFPSGSSIAINL